MELSWWQVVLGGVMLWSAGLGLGFAALLVRDAGKRAHEPWARRSMREWDEGRWREG
jgi:hypothetical protein